MTETRTRRIAGRTVGEWDACWHRLPGGFGVPRTELRHRIGLFRAVLDGEVVAIGTGVQLRGRGLETRLSDFRRPSARNRDHHFGREVNQHIAELELEVIDFAPGWRNAETVKKLRSAMIKRYDPRCQGQRFCWWEKKPVATPTPRRISAASLVLKRSAANAT